MSITSGPTVPPYTGNSIDLSPPYVSLAVPLASITPTFVLASIADSLSAASSGPKFLDDDPDPGVARLRPAHHQVEQVIVRHREKALQRLQIPGLQRGLPRPELLEHQVQLQQPSPAPPLQPLELSRAFSAVSVVCVFQLLASRQIS